MTSNQLGGACDKTFRSETLDEIARRSQQRVKEVFDKQDGDHLQAMENMREEMPLGQSRIYC